MRGRPREFLHLPFVLCHYHFYRKVGTINYTLCVDGCVFVSDDKINATFPEAMYDPSLIPIREKVFIIHLKPEIGWYV